MRISIVAAAMALCAVTWTPVGAVPENDEPTADTSVRPGITPEAIKTVLTSDIAGQLRAPTAFAFSPDDLKFWAGKAKAAHKQAPVSKGDAGSAYDLIVQIGHYPRMKGRTGGQGAYVNEQEIAALVATGLVQRLADKPVNGKPVKVLLVGADEFTAGLKSRIFLSLHTDATSRPCSVGPSVGYQEVGDAKGMHGIALALAITLGIDAGKFMEDNYQESQWLLRLQGI